MINYPPCKHCGASHGMGIEEMSTGEITPIDVCYKCLWKPFNESYKPIEEQIVLEENISDTIW